MASRTFTFALAIENSPYIIAPEVSINWFFFRSLAPITTVNATFAWLSPVIISTTFAAVQLVNFEGKNGSVFFSISNSAPKRKTKRRFAENCKAPAVQ
jgi:hypothetical protein